MDKDLRRQLHRLTEELREEEAEYPQPPRQKLTRAERLERQKLQQADPIEDRSAPVVRKKGVKGLVFLALLEILAILLIIGWWLQWLI